MCVSCRALSFGLPGRNGVTLPQSNPACLHTTTTQPPNPKLSLTCTWLSCSCSIARAAIAPFSSALSAANALLLESTRASCLGLDAGGFDCIVCVCAIVDWEWWQRLSVTLEDQHQPDAARRNTQRVVSTFAAAAAAGHAPPSAASGTPSCVRYRTGCGMCVALSVGCITGDAHCSCQHLRACSPINQTPHLSQEVAQQRVLALQKLLQSLQAGRQRREGGVGVLLLAI